MTDRPSIIGYPFLTDDEFQKACIGLLNLFEIYADHQCQWTSVSYSQVDDASLRIVQALGLGNSPDDPHQMDYEFHEFEESDDEVLLEVGNKSQQVLVEYNILLSSTYRVPTLYFSIKNLPLNETLNLNSMYKMVIPNHFKHQIKDVGVMGGVTIVNHPITNFPVFFVHPCNTAAALEEAITKRDLSPDEYLQVWIGLIGAPVGLSIPHSLVAAQNNVEEKVK